jgi:forespore regulator of the sigma-K checkpoint
MRQLKKMLRSKRKWVALGTLLLLISAGWYVYSAFTKNGTGSNSQDIEVFYSQDPSTSRQQETIEAIGRLKGTQETYIHKVYVCGEENQALGALQSDEIMQIHKEHKDWTISLQENGQVIFTEQVDDLSPECKEKGYFGIDENGNLTLFDGVPGKDNVMRTFFQLNIRYLESSLPKETIQQLHEGIRVSDLAEFNSVLSTFSDYAVEETERVLFPRMLEIE